MPKLNKEKSKAIDNAGDGGFDPIPDGIYDATLQQVEARDSAAGNVYWRWTYKLVDADEFTGRLMWDNTSLSDVAAWRLKQVFSAFGVAPDTDTDDLCGKPVKLAVSQRVIERGDRAGEIGNNVDKVMPIS